MINPKTGGGRWSFANGQYGEPVGVGRTKGRIGGLILLATLGLLAGCPAAGGDRAGTPSRTTTASPAHAASPTHAASFAPGDPAGYAAQVRKYAQQAGINPRLLMAILYNESYKPHDPSLERVWQRIDPDSGFGIANMHRAAFDETKRRHGFADRDWQELADDPDLAIRAAAWHLHDLADQLPSRRSADYTKDELLALGYNAGAGNMRLFAKGSKPGRVAQSYLDRLRDNWDRAGQAVRSGR